MFVKLQRTTLEQLLAGGGSGGAGGAPDAAAVLAVQTGLGCFELADLLRRTVALRDLQSHPLPEAALETLCIMTLAILRCAAAAVRDLYDFMFFRSVC